MSPRSLSHTDLLAREQELIDTAIEIMEQEGTAGLTMDKVVARVPYSKGTVYNHFSSREDLLTGVCNASMSQLAQLFQRAVSFKGSTRERIAAVHYAYLLHALLDPSKFMLVLYAKTANMIERTSEVRMQQHYELEGRLMGPVLQVVDEAIENGDVTLPPHLTPKQAVFTNWAGCFGVIALLISCQGHCGARSGLDLQQEVINHINLVLDGMSWRPLSNEWDYAKSIQRIAEELFPEESDSVGKLSAGCS